MPVAPDKQGLLQRHFRIVVHGGFQGVNLTFRIIAALVKVVGAIREHGRSDLVVDFDQFRDGREEFH